MVVLVVLGALALAGLFTVNIVVNLLTAVTVLVAAGYFARILTDREISRTERSRMKGYLWLFVSAAAFWLIYDQLGHRVSTLIKFAVGLILNDLSFVLMAAAARAAVGGGVPRHRRGRRDR